MHAPKPTRRSLLAGAATTAFASSIRPAVAAPKTIVWWYEGATATQQAALTKYLVEPFNASQSDYKLVVEWRGNALPDQLLVALAGRRSEPATLLLAGLAISLAAGAGTSLALALAPSPFAFYDAFDWLMGSFTDRSITQAAAALVPAAIAIALLIRRSAALDLLALGEDVAASIGLRPRRLAMEVIALSAVAVGACVSVAGAVGFVGLVAPFFGRKLSRGHPGKGMLPAAAVGALLLTVADLMVRAVPLDRPIPVGVVTALFGTPLFIWLVVAMRQRLTA